MNTLTHIIKKEFGAFFSSPIGYIFIGVFLVSNLFVFFWVETFFSTNIAEIRGLFKWMPILLIFLTSAITMRLWAEEQRSGTMELLLTSPVSPVVLVLGKFFACLLLVALALVLTLPIPVTVSLLGVIDWGPVIGGYLATVFLAAAYLSIGLYVSVKSDNQIVSLIVATLICSIFYILGSDMFTSFFANTGSEVFKLLGSGSRFESITRGVIDFRDIYYYLSIAAVFLCLNIYGLEKIRWMDNPRKSHHLWYQLGCALLLANFIAANFWLHPTHVFRSDLTQNKMYSISNATKNYLNQTKEPLLIRGYFSPQTHPLLAPLVPQIRDLLKEYGEAGSNNITLEFINPQDHPDLEQEAGQKYGIRPIPFQTASKYQSSVTNSYFHILIQYGDQFETLGFRDLIEVKVSNEQDIEVELRNPEYDITRAIKKVLYGYQGEGDLFSTITTDIAFSGYISPDSQLPEELAGLKKHLQTFLGEIEKDADGKFSSSIIDPESDNGKVADKIQSEYGFRPMAASLFDANTFWFYMTLHSGEKTLEIPLPEDLSEEALKRSLKAGLKRFGAGFAKTVALHAPAPPQPMGQFGMRQPAGPSFNILQSILEKEHNITTVDLKTGQLPENSDLLMVIAPESIDDKQLFAIDQFLMQGGTVIIATSPFSVSLDRELLLEERSSGLEDWLKFHGIEIDTSLVLDPLNIPFPIPVQRQVGGFTVQETKMVSYPYFVDIRPNNMSKRAQITQGINQITMNWSSPIHLDNEILKTKEVARLLESSDDSWVLSNKNIQPNFDLYRNLGFPVEGTQEKRLLGLAIKGRFPSYFAGKDSPLLNTTKEQSVEAEQEVDPNKPKEGEKQVIAKLIDKSPESSRLLLLSSNSFLSDTSLSIVSSVMRTNSLGAIDMIANCIDWSLEDQGLLALRGRSHFARPLIPMKKNNQLFWEYLNYGLAFLGLLSIWFIQRFLKQRKQKIVQLISS